MLNFNIFCNDHAYLGFLRGLPSLLLTIATNSTTSNSQGDDLASQS